MLFIVDSFWPPWRKWGQHGVAGHFNSALTVFVPAEVSRLGFFSLGFRMRRLHNALIRALARLLVT